MDHIYLLYAGGHAKQVIDAFLKNGTIIAGIFDDVKTGTFYRGVNIIDTIHNCEKYINRKHVFCTIGDCTIRKNCIEKYPDAIWINCIDRTSDISPTVCMGIGNYIGPNTVIGPDVIIGNHNIINSGAVVSHDTSVGDYNHIAPNTTICGGCVIGSNNLIGAGSTLIPKQTIESSVIVGAGSVVVRRIISGKIVAGCPATDMRLI